MPVLSARLCAYLSEELRMRTEKSDECRLGDADARKCGFGSAGCALRGIIRDTPYRPSSCTNAFFQSPINERVCHLEFFLYFIRTAAQFLLVVIEIAMFVRAVISFVPSLQGGVLDQFSYAISEPVHRSDEDPPRSL